MGATRGLDGGLIAGVFASKHFQNLVGIDHETPEELASIKGNVVAMVNMGSVGGAFLYVSQFPVRRRTHSLVFRHLLTYLSLAAHFWSATASVVCGPPGSCVSCGFSASPSS